MSIATIIYFSIVMNYQLQWVAPMISKPHDVMNTNAYRPHTHADRLRMGLLA